MLYTILERDVKVMKTYSPPFSITNEMLQRVSNIVEKVTKLDNYQNLNRLPILRRDNRIHSVHSSLAIEANSLSLDQTRAIINGHQVLGPQQEIIEVQNAFSAYEKIATTNPNSEKEFLDLHQLMTKGLVVESGTYRRGAEGVFSGDTCVFIAPSAKLVPSLMHDLFTWLQSNDVHPLIASSIFHYEMVFIHPFSDGNGRMARLWQTIILAKWKPVFEYVPIETQIQKYQQEYYQDILDSQKKGDSNPFIEFMLRMIDEVLKELVVKLSKEADNLSPYVTRLLQIFNNGECLSANEIMARLGLKSKETLRANYLDPALENGLIKQTLPSKPTSKNQKYYKE